MARRSGLLKRIGKGVLGIAGLRLIDSIEVFYIPDEMIFVPIISKSGCSTIKEALIRNYNPSFESSFPEIHHIDPADNTDGQVVRLKFYRMANYIGFAKSKEMHLILREPAERFISCYKDVASGKNVMYSDPSELEKWAPFSKNMSFDAFSRKVYNTPDYLSDRHFRSQSFYLSEQIAHKLSELKIFSLNQFMKNSHLIPKSYQTSKRKLNASTNENFDCPTAEELIEDASFRKRYARDIYFYRQTQ